MLKDKPRCSSKLKTASNTAKATIVEIASINILRQLSARSCFFTSIKALGEYTSEFDFFFFFAIIEYGSLRMGEPSKL